jgi:hypothetical protein
MKELEIDQRARGIPEYDRELAAQYGYDAGQRKAIRHPDALELMRETRREVRHPGTA